MALKPLRFSPHANRTRRFWDISAPEVMATLSYPDRVLPADGPDHCVVKRLGPRFIRVTYVEDDHHIQVIAVTPKLTAWP